RCRRGCRDDEVGHTPKPPLRPRRRGLTEIIKKRASSVGYGEFCWRAVLARPDAPKFLDPDKPSPFLSNDRTGSRHHEPGASLTDRARIACKPPFAPDRRYHYRGVSSNEAFCVELNRHPPIDTTKGCRSWAARRRRRFWRIPISSRRGTRISMTS